MLAHQAAFARRMRELKRLPTPVRIARIQQLEADMRASSARVEQRRLAAPRPRYVDHLPIIIEKDRIAAAIAGHQTVVICGETGSGKSTQLPKICLELGRGAAGLIGHTQPRRIAARSVAARIAYELGTQLGGAVGYEVRFSDRAGEDTYIKLMTDGILLAEIQHDRLLRQYDTLIIDEAHERSLNIDFLLGYLKTVLARRPDFKLIIASATIEPRRFAEFFDGAPIVEVSGRGYPVEVRYRPIQAEDEDTRDRNQMQAVHDAIDELKRSSPGDILVFLPGEREIHDTKHSLRKHHPKLEILPLYARLPTAEQQRIFQPHAGRRVILATNVAETSLTVPGIRHVIDTGVARISRYSLRSKVQRLVIEPISQASAKQRLGRCGRTAPGICIRVYSQQCLEGRPAFTDPEIRRSNLAAVILQMKHLGLGAIESFPFLDPPDRRFINDGYRLLELLGAVDDNRALSATGRKLGRLPIDPRLGRMILAAKREHCLREVLIITSALAAQDPRDRPVDCQQAADQKHKRFQDPRSDFLAYLRLWDLLEAEGTSSKRLRALCKEHFLSYVRLREWQDVHRQLMRMARALKIWPEAAAPELCPETAVNYAAIHRALLTGLIDQIGQRDDSGEYVSLRQRKFVIFPGSGLHARLAKWLVAAELVETSRLYARTVARIEPQWLEGAAAHLVKREYFEPHWQARIGRVGAYERVTLFGLVLAARRRIDYGKIHPAHAHEVFIREALVGEDYEARAAFFEHNRKLIEKVRCMETRSRRHDILVDQEEIYRFYAERIPEHIHTSAAFQSWLDAGDHAQCLFLTCARLIRAGADAATDEEFPACMDIAGTRLPLTYRFCPGEEEDGITLSVPLAILNQIDARRCEWLVPGSVQEKITALIRNLPKDIRRNFVPVPEVARACAAAMPFAQGALTEALASALMQITGVPVAHDVWRLDALPTHLKLRFEILEGKKVVASGRNLETLRARLGAEAAVDFQERAISDFERSGLTSWTFGTLPEVIETTREGLTVNAYPALIDERNSVSLRLTDTRERARHYSRAGLRRLYMLHLHEQVIHLRKNLPDAQVLCLYYRSLGSCESLKTALTEAVIDRAFILERPLPADSISFEARLETGRGSLFDIATELCAEVKAILIRHSDVRRRLELDMPTALQAAREDLDSQLGHLVYPGFIEQTPTRWLTQLPRYLQAVEFRLARMRQNPDKDRELQHAVEPFWRRCLEHMIQAREAWQWDTASERYRWMVEEYRVSLYAQQLGTAVKISAKRLEEQWQHIAQPA
jgi:ATP-dependent helicase HrpA